MSRELGVIFEFWKYSRLVEHVQTGRLGPTGKVQTALAKGCGRYRLVSLELVVGSNFLLAGLEFARGPVGEGWCWWWLGGSLLEIRLAIIV